MHLTALNAKSEPEVELAEEFDRRFSKESPEAIEWAFGVWRDRSPFFPAISEIRELIVEFKRGQREQKELRAKSRDKLLLEEARRRGEVLDYATVIKQLQDFARSMPEPEHVKKEKQFRHRMERASIAIGTLHLTDQQIQARRNKEREEIERYLEGA